MRLYALALIQHRLGNLAESDAALRQLVGLPGAANYAVQIAEVYTQRGERDEAFQWLDSAYDQRDLGLFEVRTAAYDTLRGDPRWRALMVKCGFEEATSS